MAKTTRKTDKPSTTPKPAPRRRRAIDESAPVEPITTRRRTATTKTTARVVATANDRTKAPQAQAASAPYEPTHDEISVRAYHIHLRRHGQPGNPEHDWLEAIHELRSERT